jgi:hypothetical protein
MMMEDPDRPPPQGAFPVWSKVYTTPSERTFLEITHHPDATAKNAYIWVFIAGTLSGLINSVMQFVIAVSGLREVMPGFEQTPGVTGMLGVTGLVGAICGAPITGLFSVAGFAIGVAIVHWTAQFLGGQGSFERFAYAMGAVTVPLTIVGALLTPLNVIPYASFCTLAILGIMSIYAIYLQLTAVKAVYRFGWLEAAGALFLPAILISLSCACLVLGLMRLAGPSVNEIFQQIQQGL